MTQNKEQSTLIHYARSGVDWVDVLLTGEGSATLRVAVPGSNNDLTDDQKRQAAIRAKAQADAAAQYLEGYLAARGVAS